VTSRHCTGVILAGGANTRFGGRPKGLERVGEQRIIDRVAAALRDATDELLLVANDTSASTWLPGVPVVQDVLPARASLVGLHAALAHARSAVLIVAWDMPFVTAPLLHALRVQGEASASAVVPSSAWGPEPLCAYYPPAALDVASRLLRAHERRLRTFVAELPNVRVLPAEWAAPYGDTERLFMNVNSDDDLEEARRHPPP
jgi:molybdenum cofactor guanylyltransferase